ncbi:MAG: TonB-dependent receptor [Bryobacter sp.]|nr:TonB-dependent receptor [Bryobacter sp. CoA8 C33]
MLVWQVMKGLLALVLIWGSCAWGEVEGRVVDPKKRAISGAIVEIRSGTGTLLKTLKTDGEGRFVWEGDSHGTVQLRIQTEGFAGRELVVDGKYRGEIELEPASVYTRLTVSAVRGRAEESASSAHVVAVVNREEIAARPLQTVGNALEGLPNVMVQQTSTAQVSPFLRGLTGYQVLNLVDGIRFNNSTFRSGPNQYLAFLEPSQAERVEALLGPTGVQYGSDSLGGTIHVSTQAPEFGSGGWQKHGRVSLAGATADLSGMAAERFSISNEKVFWLVGASGRAHNDLRGGRGLDSRNVFHRFFGMPLGAVRDLVGNRQQDTAFRQYGAETKLAVRLRPDQLLTLNYQRGEQTNSRIYKDLLGGLGRLRSDLTPQKLNWFYGRHEVLGKRGFDTVSGTFSFNQQTDGSVRQNLLATDAVTTDLARVNVYGYTGQAAGHWGSRVIYSFGGDAYDEHIDASRDVRNPVSGVVTRPRALYPAGSRYGNFGAFGQGSVQLSRKLRAAGGVRWSSVRFADPQNTLWFRDTTFHASLRYDVAGWLGVHGVVSRGFRAPNLNDLGALGLNDLGYEIPASEVINAGALLSTDAGEGALSKGQALRALAAESLMNYEFGVRLSGKRWWGRVQLFNADLSDPIVRRTLLFPAGNVPAQLAGLPVTVIAPTAAQRAQGVVTVATALDPRAVKAFVNDGASRYYGMETMGAYSMTRRLTLEASYSYILGRDLNPNRNIRRLPPQAGTVKLRHSPGGRKPWTEVGLSVMGVQRRLSGGDMDDERIGASFRRSDIATFFRATRVTPYVDATGVFRPTGETLLQIQNRVLPGVGDTVRVPLYRSTAGWAALGVRMGLPVGEQWQLMGAVENVLDRNYRVHGSGMDAPGVNVYLNLSYRF